MNEPKPQTLGKAAATLRRVRNRANLSVREMADALGYDIHTKYAYYESPRFKRDHLPFDLFVKVRDVLMAHGVPEDDINELLPEYFRKQLLAIDDRLERMEDMMRQLVRPPAQAAERPTRPHTVRAKPRKSGSNAR